MRLYSFVNYYLSPIQQGIQTAHVVARMSLNPDFYTTFTEWADIHQTIIVLNGGNCAQLFDTYSKLHDTAAKLESQSGLHPLMFREDTESLNGAATAVGIILPAWVYEAVKTDSGAYAYTNELLTIVYDQGTPAWELIDLVRSHRLA